MKRLGDEEGQVLVLFAAGLLILLLGAAGAVVDFGHAYVVKRQLQASADAAAIAGADALPSVPNAISAAAAYGTGGKNAVAGASESTSAYCLASVSYCYGSDPGTAVGTSGQANGLVVKESASVPTTFLKLFGISSVSVGAKATACGLCGAVPLDIVLVVDRTASMSGHMSDLQNGLKTFLGSLNSTLDWVSLVVLPPVPSRDGPCDAAGGTGYPYNDGSYPTSADGGYVVAPWSSDYLVKGKLNSSSQIVRTINCLQAGGGTAYKDALIAAKRQFDKLPSDRAEYTKVVVFETDGAANTAPDSYFDHSTHQQFGRYDFYAPLSSHTDDVLRPCGSALDYVNGWKAQGVVVMTVAYSVLPNDGCYQAPHLTVQHSRWSGHTTYGYVGYVTAGDGKPEGVTAAQTLQDMATEGDDFPASNAAQMNAAFATIAGKLVGAKLVPDSEAGS